MFFSLEYDIHVYTDPKTEHMNAGIFIRITLNPLYTLIIMDFVNDVGILWDSPAKGYQ